MGKVSSLWRCQQCGAGSPRWLGKCPDCGEFNTYVEERVHREEPSKARWVFSSSGAKQLSDIEARDEDRWVTGLGEFDRVMGGGIVPGSLVLLGGEPGVGKSTLLMQVAGRVVGSGRKVLIVTGEESVEQVKLRAGRLGDVAGEILVMAEIDMMRITAAVEDHRPDLLIVDSIQTLFHAEIGSAPGSVGQVRECTGHLMRLGKSGGPTIFIIGHVTKEGAIAGPRLLEHMVDAVLYFDGSGDNSLRLVRAVKNRFGATNELAVFRMTDIGLEEVANPSEILLSGRSDPAAGAVVGAAVEGTRPLLVELQALVAPTSLAVPRRLTSGLDYNRAMIVLAVLQRRARVDLGHADVYANIVGGVKINETAMDLPLAAAIVSAAVDKVVPADTALFGEIGLAGEVRPVSKAAERVKEAAKLGFERVIMPKQEMDGSKVGITVEKVGTVLEAIKALELD